MIEYILQNQQKTRLNTLNFCGIKIGQVIDKIYIHILIIMKLTHVYHQGRLFIAMQ
ncbi:hypothetical protein THIOM_002948 [Candidatus Thiomargarita nelsonii]|uniref:Uncharacterized protein n=1 Tax=Candidatus Thiomargarita nelsonii TaxID=1003181 RepID=A0A176RZV8_9GAMM|nr:hypothetical protein THIOM_002948 [Candidatus Thiomargarita nelsonii]